MNVSSRSLVSVRLRKSPLIAPKRCGRRGRFSAVRKCLLYYYYTPKKRFVNTFLQIFSKKILNNAKTSETLGIQFPDNNGGFRA